MNGIIRSTLLPTLIFMALLHTPLVSADSDYYASPYNQNNNYDNNSDTPSPTDLQKYLYNLGLYIGYDLRGTNDPKAPEPPKSTLLTDPNQDTSQLKQLAQFAFYSVFGAIPVNTFLPYFIPTSSATGSASIYTTLNDWANAVFPSYNQKNTAPVSVSELIDQKVYQLDPINQSILNILNTPDSTFCMDNAGSAWTKDCAILYQNQVMNNAIGTLPGTDSFFTYDYQQQFLNQLNVNSLIAPVIYSTQSNQTNNSSSNQQGNNGAGLTADSQAQQAANFIRYVTGAMAPMPMIKRTDYDNQFSAAYPYGASGSPPGDESSTARTNRENARASLDKYIADVRAYAAKNSVAVSNLYYILSKRMPQKNLDDSSQALNELQMATRRLYDPTKNATQWMDLINKSSPATVQKEIAILLSEINYQLYLNRQQEERLLLTNTLLLAGSISSTKPDPSLSNQ